MRKILIAFLILFLVQSCTKENSSPHKYKTIYPLQYLPAYPGSWWKYVDGKGRTSIIETEPNYELDYYENLSYYSDTFYVPIYNTIPLWGYEAHTGPQIKGTTYPFSLILSDTMPVGSAWTISYNTSSGVGRSIYATDTTIIIGSTKYYPTIVVLEFYTAGPPFPLKRFKRYYTKDIGMVREDIYDIPDSSYNVREITDYHINHPK